MKVIDYENPDMDDFLSGVVKSFCPSCGNPIIPKQTGRRKVYCSDKCRRYYWDRHQKKQECRTLRRTCADTPTAAIWRGQG